MLWALPILVALEFIVLRARDQSWAYEWLWAVDWTNSSLVLLAPLVAGIAAAEQVSFQRSGGPLLLAPVAVSTSRFVSSRAFATWAVAASAHALGVVATVAFAAARTQWQWPPLLGTLPSFALLLLAVASGVACGTWWPSRLTAPLVAISFYLWTWRSGTFGLRWTTYTGGASASTLGMAYDNWFLVTQAAWMITVSVLLLLAVVRPTSWRGLGISGLVLALLTVPMVQWPGRFVEATSSVRWHCEGDAPEVCVVAEYRALLPPLREVVSPLVDALREVDPEVVPRTVQQAVGQERLPRVAQVALAPDEGNLQSGSVAFDLLEGLPRCDLASIENDHVVRMLIRASEELSSRATASEPGAASSTMTDSELRLLLDRIVECG